MKIWPYSVNDASDYRNGVSTIDLYAIQAHLLSSPSFESRTPTEDFPFRYISGDADLDADVDEDDIEMIQDLILFYRDDLTRNSWEWVHKDEVENAEERFEEVPYEFVISVNWPYPEGIIIPALSTTQIVADNDKYFTFRTTKIGDIIANSGMLVTSLNTWVCGSGSYLTNNEILSRSSNAFVPNKIRKGSRIKIAMILEKNEDIYSIELPIFFSDDKLTLDGLRFQQGFLPRWNRNADLGTLVFSDYSKNLKPLTIEGGVIVELDLIANSDISDLNEVFIWHPQRGVEVSGAKENVLYPDVRFELTELMPPSFYGEIRSSGFEDHILFIETPLDESLELSIFSATGSIVWKEMILLGKGQNHIALPNTLEPGLYICNFGNSNYNAIKWIKA